MGMIEFIVEIAKRTRVGGLVVRNQTLEAIEKFALDFDITFKAVRGMYPFLIHASLQSILNFAVLFCLGLLQYQLELPLPRCPR